MDDNRFRLMEHSNSVEYLSRGISENNNIKKEIIKFKNYYVQSPLTARKEVCDVVGHFVRINKKVSAKKEFSISSNVNRKKND